MFNKMVRNYEYTLTMMDVSIMENLKEIMQGCTKEQFIAAYMVLHLDKYGIDFTIWFNGIMENLKRKNRSAKCALLFCRIDLILFWKTWKIWFVWFLKTVKFWYRKIVFKNMGFLRQKNAILKNNKILILDSRKAHY